MEDSTIVQMFWNRDENAITVTSEKYGSYCLTIAKNILDNSEDAEECVNDTYLLTWNSIPTNRPTQLSTYLGKIVRNLSFNRYKKSHTQKRGLGQTPLILDELSELLTGSERPEEEWDVKLLIETVNEFLEGLPETKRKLFVSRYWYADSVKDIAARFDMTENNVSVSLSRLRVVLRKYIMERGLEL